MVKGFQFRNKNIYEFRVLLEDGGWSAWKHTTVNSIHNLHKRSGNWPAIWSEWRQLMEKGEVVESVVGGVRRHFAKIQY